MKLPRRAVSVCALACGLALVTSSTAVAAIAPVLITGPSPYAACSQFDNSLTGRTSLNAHAAVDDRRVCYSAVIEGLPAGRP